MVKGLSGAELRRRRDEKRRAAAEAAAQRRGRRGARARARARSGLREEEGQVHLDSDRRTTRDHQSAAAKKARPAPPLTRVADEAPAPGEAEAPSAL